MLLFNLRKWSVKTDASKIQKFIRKYKLGDLLIFHGETLHGSA